MHSPETVAFEIKWPKFFYKSKKGKEYRQPIITIWHHDPEKDGTDDSCGWFIRQRHLAPGLLDKVINEFTSEWDSSWTSETTSRTYYSGWFNPFGENILSVRGIVLNMYLYASKICLNQDDKLDPRTAWKKAWKFLNKNYAEIMYFAENNRDSMRDTIVRKFYSEPYDLKAREEMIRECAVIVTTDVMRKLRPWWKHPRWHFHHWGIRVHTFQRLKRRYWDKCCICHKRGFKGSACSDWNGTKRWHMECERPAPTLPQSHVENKN